uniref:Uncharacterized protein n=1 Tax=Myotis myotis TaxID=51298 RepID=A0A7J7TIU7_MYOMY|nr:hypothetical protein mMyoMyo1_009098 [Myotis myotis]
MSSLEASPHWCSRAASRSARVTVNPAGPCREQGAFPGLLRSGGDPQASAHGCLSAFPRLLHGRPAAEGEPREASCLVGALALLLACKEEVLLANVCALHLQVLMVPHRQVRAVDGTGRGRLGPCAALGLRQRIVCLGVFCKLLLGQFLKAFFNSLLGFNRDIFCLVHQRCGVASGRSSLGNAGPISQPRPW